VGVKVSNKERGDKGVKWVGKNVGEGVATAFTGNLVVDVDQMKGLITCADVDNHGGQGGHGVGGVVDDGDRLVDLGFNVGDNFAGVIGVVGGVVDLPLVVGSDSEDPESKWVSV
jgi:hypothetical protein